MDNQAMRILNYIKKHGSITNMDAFRDLGITRLSGRIYDLREAGYNITMTWETSEHGTRYGRFYLEGDTNG